jgi:hypothetical protein
VLIDQGSILEIKAGALTRQYSGAIDLCSECSALFTDWLRGGKPHQTRQDGAETVLGDTAVAV